MSVSENDHEQNQPTPPPNADHSRPKKTKSRGWVFILLALAVILAIILTQNKQSIPWIENYQQGLELARKQQKPLLLTFETADGPFCVQMRLNTYVNPKVIQYVQQNFIPILIDANKNPQLIQQYQKWIAQYPAHIIKYPDSDNTSTVFGHDPPGKFIQKLQRALDKINSPTP